MKKFKEDLKAYASDLGDLGISLNFATSYENCDWRLVPRMLVAVDKQERLFHENNVFISNLPTIDRLPLQDRCGSPQELLKEYLK